MTARFQPTITIDGRQIDATSIGDDVVPLAGIKLRWGRTDLFAPTPPTTITITVLDQDGSWGTHTELVGSEITIDRPGKTMFRGSIGEVAIGTRDLYIGNTNRQVYEVALTGTCPLADLDMAILPGPGSLDFDSTSNGLRNAVYGVDHWQTTNMTIRRDNILAGGAKGGALRYVDDIEAPTIAKIGVPAGTRTQVRRVRFAEQLSLLQLIEELYAAQALGHVNYDHTTNAITIGRAAASPGLALTLDAGMIVIHPASGHSIPARHLGVSSQPKLTSTVLNSIDAILVEWQQDSNAIYGDPSGGYYENPTHPTEARATTVRTSNNKGEKTLLIKTSFHYEEAALAVGTIAAGMIDGVNNQFAMPPVTYDFRRTDSGDPALDELLLDTRSHPTPLYPVGSQFSHLAHVGPMFQIIGGTLTWHPHQPGSALDAGWTHELTLAPTVGVSDAVTIGNLVTNPGPTLEDFDPSITLADLGHVTQGLS